MKTTYTLSGQTTDITSLCSSVQWSGDMQQAARRLELQVLSPAFDKNVPEVDIKPGGMISFSAEEAQELFQGYVFFREKDLNQQTTRVLCYDGMIYLTKSTASYNFNKMTAEQIASRVCGDFGVQKGNLASTGIPQSYIVISKSPYEIITSAYENASKQNGKKYVFVMKEGKLSIAEKGQTEISLVLDPDANIINSRYSESIENMINRVKVYDDKANVETKIENAEWVKSYGVLQGVYTKEEGRDAATVAKNMLKGIEQKGDIEALGNVGCITGNAVKIKEPYSKLEGVFNIESDTHNWQAGKYTMQLTLDFKNMK